MRTENTALDVNRGSRVQSLDCLRAIACLVVILSHIQKIVTPGNWTIGAYGVGLFCVLSGYLLTSILIKDETTNGRIDPIKFLQRRCIRILPAYYALLIPCALLMNSGLFLTQHREVVSKTLSELPFYFTFTHNLGDGIGINHLWSISIEEQFYCFLPFMLLNAKATAIRQGILVLIALLMMPFAFSTSADPHYCNAAFIALILGTFLALDFSRISKFLKPLGTTTILLFTTMLLVTSMLARACPYGPLCSVAFALIIWLAVTRFVYFPKLKSVAYVGRISYGVYLVQMPVSLVTYWFMEKFGLVHYLPITFLINVALSIFIGAVSWEFFEKRLLSYRCHIENNSGGKIIALISPILLCIGVVLHLLRG